MSHPPLTTPMDHVQLLIPFRSFGGMTRLAPLLSSASRDDISHDLFHKIVCAGTDAGLHVRVVTRSNRVVAWCQERDIDTIEDEGRGLDSAAVVAVHEAGRKRWIVAHADLPFVSASALAHVARIEGPVLAPSLDGGTNVIAGSGSFSFSYGEGSFHRHLATVPDATVVSTPELSIDVDTPLQLTALQRLWPTLMPR